MFFAKRRLTKHEQSCAAEFAGIAPKPDWDPFYELPPFDLMEMADRGVPKAAYVMGDRLDQGMGGLNADVEKALIYYRMGEEQGDPDALNNIGSMHFHGDGLPQDFVLARDYFERAVAGGCPAAMNNLGRMYLDGRGGLPVDVARGMEILMRGARAYDIDAALKMQNIYHEGQFGQKPDVAKRITWLWQAIYNGNGRACALIGNYLGEGKLVAFQGERARDLYFRGTLLCDSLATLQLGLDYYTGKCGPQDMEQAEFYLAQAEAMGEDVAVTLSEIRASTFI